MRPGLDDKVLSGWNALFTRVARRRPPPRSTGPTGWTRPAPTPRFLLTALRRPEAGCCARGRPTAAPATSRSPRTTPRSSRRCSPLAEVDDVAWLDEARTVADGLIALFADDDRGGFFTTGIDAEALIVRPKDFFDNATPSENSLAADGLLRLAALTGDTAAAERAARWVATMAPVLGEHTTAFAFLLEAYERIVHPPLEVAVVGDPGDPGRDALVAELRRRVLPAAVRVTAAPGTGSDLTLLLAGRPPVDGRATAYVCERFACQLPVTDPEALRAQLDAALAARR